MSGRRWSLESGVLSLIKKFKSSKVQEFKSSRVQKFKEVQEFTLLNSAALNAEGNLNY